MKDLQGNELFRHDFVLKKTLEIPPGQLVWLALSIPEQYVPEQLKGDNPFDILYETTGNLIIN